MYTKKELTEQIKGLGIKSDDVITIHISLILLKIEISL